MKVIFLDIDGVLVTGRVQFRRFDPLAVAALNRIMEVTGAHIVISSSMRRNRTIMELDAMLTEQGVTAGSVIGATPTSAVIERLLAQRPGSIIRQRARGADISAWLAVHPEVTAWCAIDDEKDSGPERLVLTNAAEGLTETAADMAIGLLGTK